MGVIGALPLKLLAFKISAEICLREPFQVDRAAVEQAVILGAQAALPGGLEVPLFQQFAAVAAAQVQSSAPAGALAKAVLSGS